MISFYRICKTLIYNKVIMGIVGKNTDTTRRKNNMNTNIKTRSFGDVTEHCHDGYTWHSENCIHADPTYKMSGLEGPTIPIEEIKDISFDETKILLIQQANVERRGANPTDAWVLVNIKTGEFFFAGTGLYLGEGEGDEWRKIGWNYE